MRVAKGVNYTAVCRFCRSKLNLRHEEIDFHGTTVKTCPACGNAVRITDDYGVLKDEVKVTCDRTFREVGDGKTGGIAEQ